MAKIAKTKAVDKRVTKTTSTENIDLNNDGEALVAMLPESVSADVSIELGLDRLVPLPLKLFVKYLSPEKVHHRVNLPPITRNIKPSKRMQVPSNFMCIH